MESLKNGDLPEDVILEILLRLPVKTLLQLKCVCKHWHQEPDHLQMPVTVAALMGPLNGVFLVFSIQYFWNEEMDVPPYPSLVSVYNSGSDSWRHFEDVDLVNSSRCAYRSLYNTYLNGVYYWLTEFNDTDVAILAFDMSSEKFQEIQVPDCIKSKEGDLALYDGSTALLSCDLDKIDKCVDVWVMKKEVCWTKI
ncbi:probable F-box protein At1g14315 [Sesamum indicum]|uniref:Probable F-box protein At1g14315 n=1 Tax=Sesamum indicum TaxID=4182 RepID=A0A6I9SKW4_SESIN|nr:probable F-box protein At1g14315 [Sesamum indicum]